MVDGDGNHTGAGEGDIGDGGDEAGGLRARVYRHLREAYARRGERVTKMVTMRMPAGLYARIEREMAAHGERSMSRFILCVLRGALGRGPGQRDE